MWYLIGLSVIQAIALAYLLSKLQKANKQIGKLLEQVGVQAATIETTKEMSEAAAQAAHDDIVDRLRKGGF